MDTFLEYRSYLIRLWQVREDAGLTWRATLEDVKTGEQRGFASLEDLFDYIRLNTEVSRDDVESPANKK